MTLGKLFGFWAIVGAVAGVLLYLGVYTFRDSFAAGAELRDVTIAANRATGLFLIPGIGVGFVAFAGACRLTGDCGIRRWGPLVLGSLVAFGVAVALERQFIPEYFQVALPPAAVAVAAAMITIGVREWIER